MAALELLEERSLNLGTLVESLAETGKVRRDALLGRPLLSGSATCAKCSKVGLGARQIGPQLLYTFQENVVLLRVRRGLEQAVILVERCLGSVSLRGQVGTTPREVGPRFVELLRKPLTVFEEVLGRREDLVDPAPCLPVDQVRIDERERAELWAAQVPLRADVVPLLPGSVPLPRHAGIASGATNDSGQREDAPGRVRATHALYVVLGRLDLLRELPQFGRDERVVLALEEGLLVAW